jgi:hypothetical protein
VRDYIIRRYIEILRESSSKLSKLRPNRDLNDGSCSFYLSRL